MNKPVKSKPVGEGKPFDLAALAPLDQAEMEVVANGQLTGWKWLFAGPSHPMGIAQKRRLLVERQKVDHEIRSARVNNRRWEAPMENPDDVQKRNVDFVMERLIGWSNATLAGEPLLFSRDSVKKMLSDDRYETLLVQALEFLADGTAFYQKDAV